jgi:hypothetical protein
MIGKFVIFSIRCCASQQSLSKKSRRSPHWVVSLTTTGNHTFQGGG